MDRFFRYVVLIGLFIVFDYCAGMLISSGNILNGFAFHLLKWLCAYVIVHEAYRDGVKDTLQGSKL